ncbi:AAA family ATPase [Mucilaginibacter achroorhodeus]|uniref:AAA family ATPase n=1 Tax=Mucilaginibacter achroorhodeus TaxID=2599294 RepID=A0A563U159_9SPHI|nr:MULTISPECIES: AAA family ATPase [Mucilaginibacter]QXV65965.1 AAA family ATPase [Mucilaginibacter sp. 21P]TWR24179.1 AAA family ATPase [Mucilaginibacter achroorhodeus]
MQTKPYLSKVEIRKDRIVSFTKFPFNIPAIKNFSEIKFHEDVTFLVGENGSGKSTFLEGLSEWLGISQEGGSRGTPSNMAPSLLSEFIYGLKNHKKPSDYFFLRAENFYNFVTYLDERYVEDRDLFYRTYGLDSLHDCSHGEAFLTILSQRLGRNGLYLFDEPEAALSPTRLLTALSLIDNLVKQGSQLIIATHSPILLAYPNAVIYQFDEEGVKEITYEQSQAYIITKSFVNNYKGMIELLLH